MSFSLNCIISETMYITAHDILINGSYNVMNYLSTEQKIKSMKLKFSREIFPGIFQITMPLIVGKPGPVNAYLFVGEKISLIDTGTSKSIGKLENALF